jgi:hypothetical protein
MAFQSEASNPVDGDTNGFMDVFLRDRLVGDTTLVSVASDGDKGYLASGSPDILADGCYIVFHSLSNLVDGDTNGFSDVFLFDRGEIYSILLPVINH